MGISIDKNRCIGCGLCVPACPFGAIKVENKAAVILDNCTLCGACVSACKKQAVLLARGKYPEIPQSGACEGIWVFAEQYGGALKNVTFELLAKARELADSLGCKVSAVLLGSTAAESAQKLIEYGADEVLIADAPYLHGCGDQAYAAVLANLVRTQKPEVLLIGATSFGRSLAPGAASLLGTGLTADCTKLTINPKTRLLEQTRPAFGGNLMATIICPERRPQMATVRPRVFQPLAPEAGRTGKIIRLTLPEPETSFVRTLQTEKLELKMNLTDADIIIAVGKGIGGPKNIRLAQELAAALGGAVGASRPVVDLGWLPYTQQVGQTGKTVAPKLYIACGISGAVQHLAGLGAIDTVVAINNDPDAPIFKAAHYAIVGDCLEILPEMTAQVKRLHAAGT